MFGAFEVDLRAFDLSGTLAVGGRHETSLVDHQKYLMVSHMVAMRTLCILELKIDDNNCIGNPVYFRRSHGFDTRDRIGRF